MPRPGLPLGRHRPAVARELEHLDAVNIGAAGTFVIRRPVTRAALRSELAASLPFDTEIMICQGLEIVRMVTESPFADEPVRPDIVHFVSVLSRSPRSAPPTPIDFPDSGTWLLKILGRDGRFVFGLYRRQMKAIGYLGRIDQLFGVPATTRSWSTITAIAMVLAND